MGLNILRSHDAENCQSFSIYSVISHFPVQLELIMAVCQLHILNSGGKYLKSNDQNNNKKILHLQ